MLHSLCSKYSNCKRNLGSWKILTFWSSKEAKQVLHLLEWKMTEPKDNPCPPNWETCLHIEWFDYCLCSQSHLQCIIFSWQITASSSWLLWYFRKTHGSSQLLTLIYFCLSYIDFGGTLYKHVVLGSWPQSLTLYTDIRRKCWHTS